jgi:hypothetical protein
LTANGRASPIATIADAGRSGERTPDAYRAAAPESIVPADQVGL